MPSVLFVEAFGQLPSGANLIDSEEEDLYSVFNARAELMGWSALPSNRHPRRRSLLWNMNDAELTAGTGASRIGWVQVGLADDPTGDFVESGSPPPPGFVGYAYAPLSKRRLSEVELALALPALIQCFDDALRRFGIIELSAFQVTAHFLDPRTRSSLGDLVSGLNWFNTTQKEKADALIAFDQGLLEGHTEAELVASLQQKNTGLFEFGSVVAVPEQHSIKESFLGAPDHPISPARSGLGVSVTLPEWTASAVGWALAMVIDTARASAPNVSHLAVRITRVS